MLIPKPKHIAQEVTLTEMQKAALEFLPKEQVTKFAEFQHLIEPELLNEAREPEMENVIKDLFDALHERNTPKLLKVLQGDKKKLFYAFKKQLQNSERLTKAQAKMLYLIEQKELSLLSISLIK